MISALRDRVFNLPFILAGIVLLLPLAVSAETAARDGGNQAALAKAQYMLRQVSTEKEALQAENERLKEEIEKRDKKIADLNNKVERASSSLESSLQQAGRYQEAVAGQRERMDDMRDKFQALVDKYRELVAALKLVESERADLSNKISGQMKVIESCASKNKELYQVNLELLGQYERKGVWDAMLQKEPVTQLKRVEIENMIEEMEYRIGKLRVAEIKPDTSN